LSSKINASEAKIRFVDTQASVILDALRGLAALCVLLDHWRSLLFVEYPQVSSHRLLVAPIYVLSSVGHQSVVIFFVLSGYLISGSVYRMMASGSWSWRQYLTHRLVRLWIVLFPGLVLGLAWDALGLRLHLAPRMYGGGMFMQQQIQNVQAALTPATFVGNMFFLQTIKVPILGSNGALWSLTNEFWYYMLFPLALLALKARSPSWIRVLYLLGFAVIAFFVGRSIFAGFGLWLFGAFLARLPVSEIDRSWRWLAAIIYIPLVFILSKMPRVPMPDYAEAFATFLFLWVMLTARRPASKRSINVRIARSLASFSFTLYLTHMPFLVLLTSLYQGDGRGQPTGERIISGLGMLISAILLAWLVASATEFRTDSVRSNIERWLKFKGTPKPVT
jgi:peptidoglycan/LPS O-acetylase OafA/YrhL